MRPYVYWALVFTRGDTCEECHQSSESYDIDHKRYGDDVTLNDLQLLCHSCHQSKTEASGEAHLMRTPHCGTCSCY